MTIIKKLLVAATLCVAALPAQAALKIFACEPEWAALAQELGGDKVSTFSATTPLQDPHHIEARPSLIARLRQADLAICTGAELEIGWMPILLRQAGNSKVQPGQNGYLEAASVVERLEIPAVLDRALGDIHAGGNPHIHTDPRRIATVADKLAERLTVVDPVNAAYYVQRQQAFAQRWRAAIADWSQRAAPLKGMRVVSHHRDWIYLYDWLGIVDAGTLEAIPGIPPTVAHLAKLKTTLAREPARAVIRTPYEDSRPSEWIVREAKLKAVVLPYTVGGTAGATNLYTLFDETLRLLLEVAG